MLDTSALPDLFTQFNEAQIALLKRVLGYTQDQIIVLTGVSAGLSNEEIAHQSTSIPLTTVKSIIKTRTQQLRCNSRTELAIQVQRVLDAQSDTDAVRIASEKNPRLQLTPYQQAQLELLKQLTPREIEVLDRFPLVNKDIGRELGIIENTVKVHVTSALKKLGLTNRTQAAMFAFRLPRTSQAQEEQAQNLMPQTAAELVLEILLRGAKIGLDPQGLSSAAVEIAATIGDRLSTTQTTLTRPELAAQTRAVGTVETPEYSI